MVLMGEAEVTIGTAQLRVHRPAQFLPARPCLEYFAVGEGNREGIAVAPHAVFLFVNKPFQSFHAGDGMGTVAVRARMELFVSLLQQPGVSGRGPDLFFLVAMQALPGRFYPELFLASEPPVGVFSLREFIMTVCTGEGMMHGSGECPGVDIGRDSLVVLKLLYDPFLAVTGQAPLRLRRRRPVLCAKR
jgi:hypothetical protein